jgi:hypothetical protein
VSSRLNDLQDRFAEYRFIELEFRHRGFLSTALREDLIAFLINNQNQTFGTLSLDEVSNFPLLSHQYGGLTVKPAWIKVPRRELMAGPLKWYATGDSSPITQGNLIYWSTGATSDIPLEIRGVCEFRIPSIPDVLTLARKKRALAQDGRDAEASPFPHSDDDTPDDTPFVHIENERHRVRGKGCRH